MPVRFIRQSMLSCVVLAALSTAARSEVVSILETTDGVFRDTPPTEGLFDAVSVGTQGYAVSPTQRSALEFNLSSIPKNVTFNSVTLTTSWIISGGAGDITVNYGVYAGNGVVNLADLYKAAKIDGVYFNPDVTNFNDTSVVVPLDVASVQKAFATSNFIGLEVWKDGGNAFSMGFANITDGLAGSVKPRLEINYTVPVPPAVAQGGGMLLAFAGVMGLRSMKRRLQS